MSLDLQKKRESLSASLGSPLAGQRIVASPIPGGVSFRNFDDSEETTKITSILPVRANWLGRLIITPILSILSIFIFALVLYWMPKIRSRFFYSRVENVQHATHLVITGDSKNSNMVL